MFSTREVHARQVVKIHSGNLPAWAELRDDDAGHRRLWVQAPKELVDKERKFRAMVECSRHEQRDRSKRRKTKKEAKCANEASDPDESEAADEKSRAGDASNGDLIGALLARDFSVEELLKAIQASLIEQVTHAVERALESMAEGLEYQLPSEGYTMADLAMSEEVYRIPSGPGAAVATSLEEAEAARMVLVPMRLASRRIGTSAPCDSSKAEILRAMRQIKDDTHEQVRVNLKRAREEAHAREIQLYNESKAALDKYRAQPRVPIVPLPLDMDTVAEMTRANEQRKSAIEIKESAMAEIERGVQDTICRFIYNRVVPMRLMHPAVPTVYAPQQQQQQHSHSGQHREAVVRSCVESRLVVI